MYPLIRFFLESEISLEQGRAFFVNRRGQIVEVNLPKVNSKVQTSENLSFYLKNIDRIMAINAK
jgi:hypothetical protein